MLNHRPKSTQSGAPNGFALLAVLAFVLLLTILVVSYISYTGLNRLSTASYSANVQAQEIAKGGLQDIIGDLHQEIIAGSINPANSTFTQGTAPNQTTIYVPSTNMTCVPARLGYANTGAGNAWPSTVTATTATLPTTTPTKLLPTLVRVSRASQDGTPTDLDPPLSTSNYTNIYSGSNPNGGVIINRASPVSTAAAAINGHYISPARWNKTMLLAPTTSLIPTPFSPTGATYPRAAYPATPDLPDWVYVTRTGSRVCANTPAEIAALKPSNTTIQSVPTSPGIGQNPPASPVIGRYAFVMYDEGALLDANVAGFTAASNSGNMVSSPVDPATGLPAASGMTQAVNGKSYQSYADLSEIPGFFTSAISPPPTAAQTKVDALVNLRNASAVSTGNSYLQAIIAYAKTGFLNFQPGDSPFVSRQDLINYFTKVDANINTSSATTSQALTYLGTFSRAVSAPSYTPPLNSSLMPNYVASMGTAVAYKDNAETVGIANRDLANVRFTAPATVNHYSDDATVDPVTYTANVGDQLLQNRFSLAKINWLSQADPNAGTAPSGKYPAAIQSCFGLVWGSPGSTTTNSNTSTSTANGGNPCWNYVGSPAGPGGSAATFNGIIETLDQVALEGREPNFFELLKAAILSGSVGLGPGPALFNNGVDTGGGGTGNYANGPFDLQYPTVAGDLKGGGGMFSHTFGPASTVPVPARIPDVQIIKIGANIIDQYDTDSYPTAIYFPYQNIQGSGLDPVGGSGANAFYGPVTMVYGDENLPVLTRVMTAVASPNRSGTDVPPAGPSAANNQNTYSLEGWLQPELWNPHMQPATALTSLPQNFQIRAYGNVYTYTGESPPMVTGSTPPPGAASTTPPWNKSQSNVQSYWPGALNTETGPNVTAGTINFSITPGTYGLYPGPRLLVTDKDPVSGAADIGAIPGVVNVSSLAGSTTVAGNFALPNFPYYSVSEPSNAAGGASFYNHFVAFTAGLISTAETGPPPYEPYYVSASGACNAGVAFVSAGAVPIPGASFAMGWLDTSNRFHPYSFISGTFAEAELTDYSGGYNGEVGFVQTNSSSQNEMGWGAPDPRTDRFSHMVNSWEGNPGPPENNDLFSANAYLSVYRTNGIPSTGNFNSFDVSSGSGVYFPQDWLVNSITPLASTRNVATADPRTSPTYYADPDGVVRPADGVFSNASKGDGNMLFITAGTGSSAKGDIAAGTTTSDDMPMVIPVTNSTGNARHGRRPIILNRPFRSVGELGYVFRDLPFKTLDFFSAGSADAALLDVFSLVDESKVSTSSNQLGSTIAGQVSLANAPYPVIAALLAGGAKKDVDATFNLGVTAVTDLTPIAQQIFTNLQTATGPNPLPNRAALVTQLGPIVQNAYSTIFPFNKSNKAYLEGPVRAMADSTDTRTWNLLVDIIAQSGQMTSNAASLNDFAVQGEKRYWLHIAIDRYTGKVVAQQLEPVYE
jgi:Tfp pilus assembly protein PilX